MKNAKAKAAARPANAPASKPKANRSARVIDAIVEEGDLITFTPTGEQVRITKVEAGRITFEKSP